MRSTTTAMGLCALAVSTSALAQQFVPGHYYSPVYGGMVVEWDQSLQQVRSFSVPGVSTFGGGTAFTDHNTLLVMGYRQNSAQIMEIDASGSILQSYSYGGTLLTGAHIATDPVTGMYGFANNNHLTVLNKQFQVVANSPNDFGMVDGVAFDQSGHLFADDADGPGIREYGFDGSSLAFQSSHPALFYLNEGMQWCSNNTLIYVRSEAQDIARLNLADDTTTFTPIGVGFRAMSDVHQLPDGDFLIVANNRLYEYTDSGQLVNQSLPTSDHSFGVAVYVPAPSAAALLGLGGLLACRRRRQSNQAS